MPKTETEKVIEKIFDYTLEDIMGERFGSYSKYIIQDRAIPDARDGLKPVQRRILYSMYKEHNTHDKGYRKSAKTVGDVIGNYHPHGDTSIYDAMVRMSQNWKTRDPYIDMHGNNGSIDGDSPAAYRYTEARLSKIAGELLKDIDRDTVEFAPNFDDTTKEPTVLPARFPSLLVYGAQGISAGYATNIPPHNLSEVIDATIHKIDNPNCSLDTLMKFVKGPDFPTGAIIEGIDGIKQAYETGKGRIFIKSKLEFNKKTNQIIITEIPFEVNKALLVKKIDDIRLDKKIDGIVEVRDESDKDIRIVIDLKKTAREDVVINYLLKNTDLQISYNFNMVTIVNRRPKLIGLKGALDAFINHQKEVVTRRTKFDLQHAKERYHIVEGLVKCISILDEVIKVIRASKNKGDAKANLVKEFAFTEVQAEAIVMLQLYRLTNTDVVLLEEELANLRKIISELEEILNNEESLKMVMKNDLRRVKKEFGQERLTEVVDEITEIKIDEEAMIPSEEIVVLLTKDGYIKRSSYRSYKASTDDPTLKDNDYILNLIHMNTKDTLLVFTSLGNYLYIPAYTIFDLKWKDMPKHISNLIEIKENEEIINAIPVKNWQDDKNIIIASKDGMIKKSKLAEFKVSRYSKPMLCMKLKENDRVVNALIEDKDTLFINTNSGYGLSFKTNEIPLVGLKTAGVKSMKLKNDYVTNINLFDNSDEFLTVITDKATAKRIRLSEFELSNRAKRGLLIIREVKSNPYKVLKTFIVNNNTNIGIKNSTIKLIKVTEFPILDRYSTGKEIEKNPLTDTFVEANIRDEKPKEETIIETTLIETEAIEKEDIPNKEVIKKPKKEKISLKETDDRLLTIDDFLD